MSKHKVKFTIFKHIIHLQELTGQRLSDSAYSRLVGVNRLTFASLMRGDVLRIENETIEKLLDFFEAQGMPLEVCDLYETTTAPTQLPT